MRYWFLAISAMVFFPVHSLAKVTLERNDRGVVVKIDGEVFTEYHTQAGQAPACWPIVGPGGSRVTRGYPFTPPEKGGTRDHPHHQSLWMTHGDVNKIDFWATNRNDGKGEAGPHIAHREFVRVESHGDTAELVTQNDWMNGNQRVCEDSTSLVFGGQAGGDRWIDYTILLKASDRDVTFGDTKEGTFAIRVADSMRVDAKQGGRIVNSEGLEDAKAWGQPARWVDYTGPVERKTQGIAILCHPKSFRPVPRWHVRTYGLFAVNPFGQHDFPNPEAAQQGAVVLKKGESLTFKYRVWFHGGATDVEKTEAMFREYASK
ncbi:MAG: PmoA family protein [Pirellulales bacterium]|nr:PmoA family protein [Pirellulales bacterium]